MGNTSTHFEETMQEQVLGPILYSGKLNCERKYHLISNTTYKNFINDQQRSASNLHIQPQIFGPINYQNKVIYALSCPIKVFKEKIIGYVYISDVYYVISEEEYLLNNDQKKMQQLQQFMQQLVRPINYYNNTEGYGISKENYEFILEIIPAIKKTKLIVNEVCYIISKKKYDSYLNMQNEHIRKLLRKIVLEQKSSKSTESYLISEDNYNHFITKIQSLKQKEKKVRHEKYYEISGETYSLLQNIQNGQQIPEQQDELPFMQQVIGQINYLNKDCYIIDKENYEYFFKLSNKQSEGQVKIKEEYNVISKEFYNEILQQLTSEKLQYMQRQILGPVNCLNEEIYIIGETYGNDLNDEQIIRRIKIDKEYYIIDKEAYDKVYDHLRFQQFVERLSVKLINHNNTVFYGIDKTNYDNIISEKIPKEQIMESMPVQENYYVIRKDAYTGYFQGNRQIENFMEQFTYDLDNWHYCIYKENYDCFFKNIINDKELKQITAVKKYHGINREVYDECILKIDPKQQVKLMLQNFTQRQVLGRLNYLGEECYVVDKENYNNLLNRIQADQRTIDQIARPIRISVDYYIIIKQTYDSHLGPVDTSSKRNDLVNYILSQNQALEEECKKLRNKISRYQAFEDECKELKSQNQAFEKECERLKSQKKEYENQITELRGEATKYQSELGDATSFHLGNQDSNSTSKLSDDIRMLHEKLVGFCNVKKKVVINYQELKELMKKYDCLTTDEISKNLISGVLERTVIETILEKTNVYLNYEKVNKKQRQDLAKNNRKQQPYLEAKILSTADELLKMTDLFTKIRVGNDRVSEAIPTKLRQQVYAILGNRGFSETFENNNDGKEHPFIVKLQEDILNIMNRYREFENQERLKKSTEEINKIIRDVITIFFFRLKVQQPIAAWYWLPKGTKIDTLRMEASWDTNETDLQFEICAFPLVGSNINQPNEKVIFPAQVIMNTLDE